uniref:Uncharacterized protein n=1 Tax=Alexandrium andersonii TaxID=327968 RepID=A0A7S2BEJ3_9DINO|mmetsp:Transcript_25034/g.56810  ORF Transcript_25034/g.56810 Transcript_25034/m.56810 type:complete len:292 (+) Transcript_25034:94-969(+)
MRSLSLNSGDRTPINQPQGYGGPPPLRKGQNTRPIDLFVTVLLPWLVFTLIVSLFVFAYEEFAPLVWALLVASTLLALLFVAMGGAAGRAWHLTLGFLILASLGIAIPLGLYIENGYMKEYWRLDNGAVYRQVSPSDPGASHSDATVLEFMQGAFVDVQRSVGYMQGGTVYCVAPVSGRLAGASIQYWAVGNNCCEQRGNFLCDDVEDAGALSGLAVHGDESFKTAVRMAESVYDLSPSSTSPVLVKWTSDAGAYKDGLWTSAAVLVVISSIVHLVASMLAGFITVRYLLK